MLRFVAGDPYAWPYDGRLEPSSTAFIIIDMQARMKAAFMLFELQPLPLVATCALVRWKVVYVQVDFCGRGGYVDQMGYDLSMTRAPIEPIK
jgi:hypothetical protein